MTVLRCWLALALVVTCRAGEVRSQERPALVPQPARVVWERCPEIGRRLDRPLRFPSSVDPGGFEILRERWVGLGIPAPIRDRRPDVVLRVRAVSEAAYALDVGPRSVHIDAPSAELHFDALATLAQLPVRHAGQWWLPCVAIVDRPALRWRIVSDDISRGPFPTLHYVKERIRTLAALKINGWSPYMEQVFFDPAHPYVATPNLLTARDLHVIVQYAKRFHVTLIPEQQTFAHMHEALKYESLAHLAELPHGYLLSPSDAQTYAYLEPLIRAELAATGAVPFFHIGADEPLDLGRGRTPRTAQVYAEHVSRLGAIVSAHGARTLIWDDAIQHDPTILQHLARNTIIVTFHYAAEPSFEKYIATVAKAGFTQFIAPGANNWNEIYADLDTAYANEAQFIADGQAAHVLGLFETVWHDDGESLFEATWSPVAFAAASAWQSQPVDRLRWHTAFARVFFGSDDPGYAADLDALAALRTMLRTAPQSDPPNYLFWSDPFDTRVHARLAALDLSAIRLRAEAVLTHVAGAPPPLHAAAVDTIRLAALRYDDLGRRAQIGTETRAYYEDARVHAAMHDDDIVYRDLNIAKYLCWELRDELTALEPAYVRAWQYESTQPGLDRVLVRYHLAAQDAVRAADRLDAAAREDYLRNHRLPTFESVMDRPN